MSEVDGQYVKLGIWTNLDKGQVMGRTITTNTRTGIIIIAVTAVLSTIGTSYLWNLLVFAYHQSRATGRPADGFFRQQQALMRTLPPSGSMMADSVKLWWSWRKRNRNVLRRSLAPFMLSTLCTAGFIAAGIFSSYVVSTSDLEVLVKSPFCGHLDPIMKLDANAVWVATMLTTSDAYANDCYGDQAKSSTNCRVFTRPSISFRTESTTCPFSLEFCTDENSEQVPAVAFDSGLVDLNDGFGTNFADNDRVSYRRRTTCSILPLIGHVSIVNASNLPENLLRRKIYPFEEAILLHYGEKPSMGQWKNATTIYSLMDFNRTQTIEKVGSTFIPATARNAVIPSQGLRRDDSDTAIITLINTVEYLSPVYDPWLLARKPEVVSAGSIGRENITLYLPDSPLRAMGCTIQHQFCIKNASGDQCTELAGRPPNVLNITNWQGASSVQLSTLKLLDKSIWIGFDTQRRTVADEYAPQGIVSAQIPPDQWIIEARGAESFAWAAMQVSIGDYAIGPGVRHRDLLNATHKPETSGDQSLCNSVKMRKAGGFVNVNVFGLAFVIATSLFLTIIDIVLLKYLVYLSNFRKTLSPRIDRWIQDGVLQLQRRAYEAQGQGVWSDIDQDVPLTGANEILNDLPLTSVILSKPTSLSIPPTSTRNPPSSPSTKSAPPSPTQNQPSPIQAPPPQIPSTQIPSVPPPRTPSPTTV